MACTTQRQGLRRIHPQRHSHVQDTVLSCRQGNAEAAVRELLRCARLHLG